MTLQGPDPMPAWLRPIRVPAHIEVTHADPPFALAGQTSTWRLCFVLSESVPAGSSLKLQVAGGRNNRGFFVCAAPVVGLSDGTLLPVTLEDGGATYVLSVPRAGLKAGDALTVTLAACAAPKLRQLNKFFILYVAPAEGPGPHTPRWAGGGVWAEGSPNRIVAACTMHVLGGVTHHLRAYAPSHAVPGERVGILVRPEDEFGNLSHEKPGRLSVFLGATEQPVVAEAVEQSACRCVRVALPGAGAQRLRVLDRDSGREATTNPIICGGMSVWWGMIHGHTEMSDGTGSLEWYFHQLRNELALDFAASSDHDHRWETSDAFWRTTCETVRRWNQPGRFAAFLGYEWAKWRRNGDGDRNVYYLADDRPMYRSDDGENPSPPDLFGALVRNRETAIVIPHHTGHGGNFCDWKDHDASRERLVEIHQVRGSYECSEADGNPVPERGGGVEPFARGYVRDALALGWRVGFTAGGDDHIGQWGSETKVDSHYKQGLMCVEAPERSRESIFAAMYNRRVVATTGARMLLSYRVNGFPMGSELSLRSTPELETARRLTVEFHGTGAVARVDIIRNNIVAHTVSGSEEPDVVLSWEDRTPMAAIWLPAARHCSNPFAFYYVRVEQRDGEVAWASPIWIDP